MNQFLFAAAGVILATVWVSLVRILRGPTNADRMMAALLLGTGGIVALLLSGTASGVAAVMDVALTVALLAAFAGIGFVTKYDRDRPDTARIGD